MRLLYILLFSVHTFTYCYRLGSWLKYNINTMLINHKHHSEHVCVTVFGNYSGSELMMKGLTAVGTCSSRCDS
jgi:hypothetical protein